MHYIDGWYFIKNNRTGNSQYSLPFFRGDGALSNVSIYKISIGQTSYQYDVERELIVYLISKKYKLDIIVKSSSLSLHKQPWPYEDNCFDYTLVSRSMNRADLMANCQSTKDYLPNEEALSKKLYSNSNQSIAYLDKHLNKCNKNPSRKETAINYLIWGVWKEHKIQTTQYKMTKYKHDKIQNIQIQNDRIQKQPNTRWRNIKWQNLEVALLSHVLCRV